MPQTFVPSFDHPRKTAFKKCNANEDVSSYVWTNKQQLGKNLVKHTGLSMGCFFSIPTHGISTKLVIPSILYHVQA